ncbi:MAG: ABC transporter ATP-binding protein [Bacteroidia bacterium]|nr:ABC transporter ATP-binding protein [Bacteroidia bacterium]
MKSLKVLNKYFLKYKVILGLGFLFVTLNSVLLTFPGVFLGKATNLLGQLIKHPEIKIPAGEFIWCGIYIILFAILGGFFMFLMRQTIIVMSRHIEYDQKNEIFDHYQSLDQNFYKRNYTGDLMNRINEDVSRVRMYTGPAIMYIANTLATVVTAIIFMVKVDWRMALVVIAPLPILSFIIYKVSARINEKSTALQEKLSDITSHAQESFSGVRVIKSFNRQDFFANKFENETAEYKKRGLSLALTEAFFMPFMIFMVGLSLILSVYFGGMLTISGEIKSGDISSYVFYIFRLTWPFASLGWVTSLIQRAAASQTRINEFLQTVPKIKNENTSHSEIKGKIEFKNVSFVYEETGIKALDAISFTVNPGSSIAFIGPSGSGKSTIASLICRMFDVNSGEILIDNTPIKKVNLFDLRAETGYVPQEVFLFSDTISNNISFGLKEKNAGTDEKILTAAKNAAVYENIIDFPEKFNTMVGERGVTLSGGQKQRISIARAIIKEPKILIFDDCLSAVDTETEDEILGNLEKLMKGKTSIIISHRVSSIKNADFIVVLENGKIAESGTHQQLLGYNGVYALLNKLQTVEKGG